MMLNVRDALAKEVGLMTVKPPVPPTRVDIPDGHIAAPTPNTFRDILGAATKVCENAIVDTVA
jgi:hypothetical protein